MMVSPWPMNGASDISATPSAQPHSASQPQLMACVELLMLHSMPAMAMNHTSTDRSTWATSATWKKSATGKRFCKTGVRDSTSNTENTRSEEHTSELQSLTNLV